MDHQEIGFVGKDGLRLYGQIWSPAKGAQAVVCLVHGMGEHSGRYAKVAEALTSAGLALVAMDLRGHGHSDGPRGHAASFDLLMDDITRLIEEGSRRYPNLPVFLYGHSMGGNLVLNYGIRCQPQIAGAVVTAPGIVAGFQVPAWKTILGKALYNLAPSMRIPNGLERAALSRDPQVVITYAADPLVHDRVSTRLGLDVINEGRWALEHAAQFKLPLLIMQGSADRIVSPEGARRFAEAAGGETTFKLWDGLYHEIHNEPERSQVVQLMIGWITQHIPCQESDR